MGSLASAGQGRCVAHAPERKCPHVALCVRRVRCLSLRITVGHGRCAQTVGVSLWPHRGARGSTMTTFANKVTWVKGKPLTVRMAIARLWPCLTSLRQPMIGV